MDLLDLAPRQRWSALAARTGSHPDEITARDSTGLTALHWACFNRPPAFAVLALLENAPPAPPAGTGGTGSSPRDQDGDGDNDGEGAGLPLPLMTDVHGTTPLHAACASHASPPVVSALVSTCPAAALSQDRSGWTPLHYICGTAFASTFGSATADGVSNDADDALEVVRILVDAEPTCVDCVDLEGQSPLGVLCGVMGTHHDPGWNFGRRGRRRREHSTAVVPSTSTSAEEESAAEEWFWSVARILARTSYLLARKWPAAGLDDEVGTARRDAPPVLHQLVSMPSSIPKELVQYVLARHPEQATLVDDDGNFPLHLAAASPATTTRPDFISDLLSLHPEAARVCDGQGRLPLQTAILSGKAWGQGVGNLLESQPEALQTCGLGCAVYPSLLGKIARHSEDGALTTLFRIIRSKPDLCRR